MTAPHDALREAPSSTALDGFTLFRFAHMYRSVTAGGMERYLGDLNRRLLDRNHMRIVQMYLKSSADPAGIVTERVGRGELIWVPSIEAESAWRPTTRLQRVWSRARQLALRTPFVRHDLLLSVLHDFGVNLAVFHWLSPDSRQVQNYLIDAAIPFVVVNHFENGRLEQPLVRAQVKAARAVGGVSGVGVPESLQRSFTNLSDGIDTDFFNPQCAAPLQPQTERPLILLPSRVIEGKGHLDAVYALGQLRRKGVDADLVCVGRVESDSLVKAIDRAANDEGVRAHVALMGQVSASQLRDWYGACWVVVFPTYAEGLGRVLLEAQAMKRVVIAYDVGGVSEALRHGITGYLVPKGSTHELAQRIAEVLQDTHLRTAMGDCGRADVVDRFSLDALAARHERFYENAVRVSGSNGQLHSTISS